MMSEKQNTGCRNTGNLNTGNLNTGDLNTGDLNTGNWNTGSWNTGNWNTGNRNTGNWNTGNYHVGAFNTIDADTALYFNKPCLISEWVSCIKPSFLYIKPTKWVHLSEMTELEKMLHKDCVTNDGFLKEIDLKEAYQSAYEEATKEDKELLFKLPNFDDDIFFEITGIDVREKEIKEMTLAEIEEKLGYAVKVVK